MALWVVSIPREFIPAVEKGLHEAITTGVLAGYPAVDIKVRCLMVHTMMLTPLKWHLKLLLLWRLKQDAPKHLLYCLSRL